MVIMYRTLYINCNLQAPIQKKKKKRHTKNLSPYIFNFILSIFNFILQILILYRYKINIWSIKLKFWRIKLKMYGDKLGTSSGQVFVSGDTFAYLAKSAHTHEVFCVGDKKIFIY